MSADLYRRLVDLYAARELPSELEDEMEMAAFRDPGLGHDMATLRRVADALASLDAPEFTEESNQRVLRRFYQRGVEVEPASPTPASFQLSLPIQS